MFRRGSLGATVLAILLIALTACGGDSPTATTAQQATTSAAPAATTRAATAATTRVTTGAATATARTATASPARTATAASTARATAPPAATATRGTATATRAGTAAPAATATRGTATATRGTATGVWGPTLAPLTGGQTYDDPQGRFSFDVPQEWTEQPAPLDQIEVLFASEGDLPNVNVALESVPASIDTEAYNQAAVRQLQQLPGYAPVSLDRVVINGQRAYKRVSKISADGQEGQLQQVYFVDRGTAHVITFASTTEDFAQNEPLFDSIAGSYKVGP